MAKAKGNTRDAKGSILTEAQVNRLEVVLEQIEGCVEILFARIDQKDLQAVTAANIILEKAKAAVQIVREGVGPLP